MKPTTLIAAAAAVALSAAAGAQTPIYPPDALSSSILQQELSEAHTALGGQAASTYRVLHSKQKVPVLIVNVTQWGLNPDQTVNKDDEIDYAKAIYPLRFRPTAMELVGDRSVVLSGITKSGVTVIERHTFTLPVLKDPSNPNSSLTAGGLRTVSVLYSDTVVGRTNIGAMRKVQYPGSTKLLTYFYESGDIYLIDDTTPNTLDLIATPTPPSPPVTPTPLVIGELDMSFVRMDIGEHQDLGYTYALHPYNIEQQAIADDPTFVGLVLLDNDRDGTIESSFAMTMDELNSRDWFNYSKWQ